MRIVLLLLNQFLADQRKKPFTLLGRKGAYAPTTLTVLASLVPPELQADITIIDEFVEEVDPNKIRADLVGISFTTPNAPHAYRISSTLRQRGMTVVLGGYHVSAMPEEAQEHADSIVIGYAERSWPRLLLDHANGVLKERYSDPYQQEYQQLQNHFSNLIRRRRYVYPYTLEASRSCVNSCAFCVVPGFSGRKMAFRSTSSIQADVLRMKSREVIVLDSALNENEAYLHQICGLFRSLGVQWQCAVTFKLSTRPDLIREMARSGCMGVFVGFETLKRTSLTDYNKRFNRPEHYRSFIDALHQAGIYVWGSFVFGFDGDGPEVFDSTIELVEKSAMDVVHLAILTPFPGTRLYKDLSEQGRILSTDWSRFDGLHVNFEPSGMTAEQLQHGFWKAHQRLHSLGSITRRYIQSPCSSAKLFAGNVLLGMYGRKLMRLDHA